MEPLLAVEDALDLPKPSADDFEPTHRTDLRPDPEATDLARALPSGEADPALQATATRIMVVDDKADVRNLLRDYLESEGYAVAALGSAAEALSRLAEFRPRVVLLDILMPDLSGLTALREIRARDPEVGVIMVTGNGDLDTAKESLALGAFDYVTKPIDFEYLKRSLDTCLLMRQFLPGGPR